MPNSTEELARARLNFNGLANPQDDSDRIMECDDEETQQQINENESVMLLIGYSTACGSLQQIAICKDNTKQWETSIYSSDQAVIATNSLSDQYLRFPVRSEAWKMATDDSFMRGYDSSKMGARTNIKVSLQRSLTPGIIENELIKFALDENQNNHNSFIATRSYPTPTYAEISPQMHYLCDAIIRFTFDDAPDPQILNIEIEGEIDETVIRPR
ncbi:MAG: hypothetical protein EZS28_007864 [Streblomastix strix]|uniref:Uncharacterized protein n=1 Tax=Streblomastix strix TaxID=222440 RepID=A0A5J4WPR1_9EUKA|nr:MAG: hypothetical protein EZS28_007864 [Streblomastix strix]